LQAGLRLQLALAALATFLEEWYTITVITGFFLNGSLSCDGQLLNTF
jgi:hypothetical protein